MSFFEKLEKRVEGVDSLLCIGLDPHQKELFPNGTDGITEEQKCDAAYTFCKTLIRATVSVAACYKPNAAFFEALGPNMGVATLKRVLNEIPSEIPILLDVKRGDIGSTASAYAEACYDHLGADAVTLSPLMGWDSVAPFVTGKYANKGAFLLCKTSNPGSNDLLTLRLTSNVDKQQQILYEAIAQLTGRWSAEHGANLGLVVGATDPQALAHARQATVTTTGRDEKSMDDEGGDHNVWILAPGVGAQGGDLDAAVAAGLNPKNGLGLLIPVSRGISQAADPAVAAREFHEAIQMARNKVLSDRQSKTTTTSSDVISESTQNTSIQEYQKDFLNFALAEGVLKFGSFVLKSGRTSPYFFNAGLFASGRALFMLGKAYASAIMKSNDLVQDGKPVFDVIFGPAYKGISLGAVVAASLFGDFGIDVGFAYNRKEAKDHGEGGTLVGVDMAGKKVLVVDDVITAGTAIRESYDMLMTMGTGTQIVGVVIALDRAEKRSLDDEIPISAVQAVTQDLGIPVVSIVNLPQLQIFLEKSPDYDEVVLKSVADYRAQYGV